MNDNQKSDIASLTLEEKRVLLEQILAKNINKPKLFPLSFSQQQLWFIDQLERSSSLYTIPLVVRIEGKVDYQVLQDALQEVVQRHETLRTTFTTVEGQAVQVITPHLPILMSILEISADKEQEQEIQLQTYIREEIRHPFDLTKGPLLRSTLFRLSENRFVLLITMHHIISDEVSVQILLHELSTLYGDFQKKNTSSLPPLSLQYSNFTSWQRNQQAMFKDQLAYWQENLAGSPPLLMLPTDYPYPTVRSYHGDWIEFHFSDGLSNQVKKFCQKEGVTLFMTLLTAFTILLYRYSKQEDILVGTPVANRAHTEFEQLIGFFVNTIVLRTKLTGAPSFKALLHQVKETCLEAYSHQDLPFEQVVEALKPERSLGYNPIFQVMFSLQNSIDTEFATSDTTFQLTSDGENKTAKFDLSLDILNTPEGLHGGFEYSVDLFDAATIQRIAQQFIQTIQAFISTPDISIASYPLLTKPEYEQMIVAWNKTQARFPHDLCIHQLFEAQVERIPDAEAVVYQTERLSYKELNNRANQIAHRLRKVGVGPEVRVGIFLERSINQVVAVLAILKVGGVYVALDPTYPRDRLAFMLEDSRVSVLLTQPPLLDQLPTHETALVFLDEYTQEQCGNLRNQISSENLAFMIYTSGSTGTPKGAMLTHANLVNYCTFFSQRYHLPTRIHAHLQMASISFDVFIADIVRSLCIGAKLVMAPYETVLVPEHLYALMCQEQVDSAEFVPAVLKKLTEHLEQAQETLEFMHLLAAGADTWPMHDYIQTLRLCDSKTVILNVYGLTEATIDNAHFEGGEITRWVDGSVPIGRPIANTQLYILDEELQPVPIGIQGELYVGGAGLGRGYFNRPDLTAERFIPNPFSHEPGVRLYRTGDVTRYRADGVIEFLGRNDQQVKIHGFRIELGEIEGALARHPAVREVLVLAREDTRDEKKLVAYITQQLRDESSETWGGEEMTSTWDIEQVGEWQVIFEDLYSPDRVVNMEELDAQIGWNSSYTDQRLPIEEVNEWVDCTINLMLAQKPTHVLETGCGSGLLLPRIAPSCTLYWGTDFSNAALQYIREQLKTLQPPLPQVTLLQRAANDFTEIEAGIFDGMLMASVTQYFPNIDYLYSVLDNMIQRIKPSGFIFIADVRNLLLLEAFHTSVQTYRAPDAFTREQLLLRIRQNIAQEKQLAVDPSFFRVLQLHLPQIKRVDIWLRRGYARNELTNYRYDVVLRIGNEAEKEEVFSSPDIVELDWQQQRLTLERVCEYLTQNTPTYLSVRGVPNARTWLDIQTGKLLKDPEGPATVGDLRALLHTMKNPAVDPEDMWALGNDLPYTVDITWTDQDTTGSYNVLFQRKNTQSKLISQNKVISPMRASNIERMSQRSWSVYANNPTRSKMNRELLSQLRRYLGEHLPQYMLPSAFVLLENFPLTLNGKVDRRALPPPGRSRPDLEERYVEPRTPIEERIAAIWSDVLGLDQIGIFDNFFALGGHSLLATHLVFQVSKALQVECPLRVLFESPTVAKLAEVVNNLLLGQGVQETQNVDLMSEVILDPQIEAHSLMPRTQGEQAFLLTGATGFLGAYLLHEILQSTSASVYCLVRAISLEEGRKKLKNVLMFYLLWTDTYDTRIIPLIGDLAQPLLGLSPQRFEKLTGQVDAIYHCGAWVNFTYPYHLLKAVNVLGTQDILRLASQRTLKPVHFISTLSVFSEDVYAGQTLIREDDPLEASTGLVTGYEQTKWVAEKLVMIARTRGIPTTIYRPGLIVGNGDTGIGNTKDQIWAMLKGCIQLGCAPIVDMQLDLTPIDYVAAAIVYLSRGQEFTQRAFHLFNPHMLSWKALIEKTRMFGYYLQDLPYDEWLAQLRHALNESQNNVLAPFMSLLEHAQLSTLTTEKTGMLHFADQHTREALMNTAITCTKADELLNAHFAYFIRSGFLNPPDNRLISFDREVR